jgi:hypothetical protein
MLPFTFAGQSLLQILWPDAVWTFLQGFLPFSSYKVTHLFETHQGSEIWCALPAAITTTTTVFTFILSLELRHPQWRNG